MKEFSHLSNIKNQNIKAYKKIKKKKLCNY